MRIFEFVFYCSMISVFLLSGPDICSSHCIIPGFLIERSIAVGGEENPGEDETDSFEKEFTMVRFSFNPAKGSEGCKIYFSGLFHENNLAFSIWQPPESV